MKQALLTNDKMTFFPGIWTAGVFQSWKESVSQDSPELRFSLLEEQFDSIFETLTVVNKWR